MKTPKIIIQDWNDMLAESGLALLKKYQETSLFLLNNLKELGPHRTDAGFSGDYKCLGECAKLS